MPPSLLDLADYRRRTGELYAEVRDAGGGRVAWDRWRDGRDSLFRGHPQSPLDPADRPAFARLPYFAHDPAWRAVADVELFEDDALDLAHSGSGLTRFVPFGVARFSVAGTDLELTLLWLDAYGGGIFLPFRDTTSGRSTYGGGRYLLDTAKGADLGREEGRLVVDFNYAYHPSCVHSDTWSCPLAPPGNRLPVAIEAGECLSK